MPETSIQELGYFAALIGAIVVLGRMFFEMRKTEATANVRLAELNATIVQAQITAEKDRGQRELLLANSLAAYQKDVALVHAGMMTTLAGITGKQDQTTTAVGSSQRTVSNTVTGARDDIIAHIDALREFISKSFDVFTADQAGFVERYEAALEVFRIKTEQIAEAQEVGAVA